MRRPLSRTLLLAAALAATGALAGCLDAAPVESASRPPDAPADAATREAYEREDREHVHYSGPGAYVYSASASFHVPPKVRVVNATLTAAWDATTPLAETLEVRVARVNGAADEQWVATGSSPLVMDLTDAALTSGAYDVRARAPAPGVMVDQEVRYAWTLTLEPEDAS